MPKQNMNWFATVLRVVICFILLTDLTEFSVQVLCGWSVRWSRRSRCEKKEGRQDLKLGDDQGTPSKYSRRLKCLSFGIPQKASHLPSSTIIGMSRFLFCSHDMHKFLERLLHLVFTFLLCTMLVWDSPWLIYRMLIALHLNLLSMAL